MQKNIEITKKNKSLNYFVVDLTKNDIKAKMIGKTHKKTKKCINYFCVTNYNNSDIISLVIERSQHIYNIQPPPEYVKYVPP